MSWDPYASLGVSRTASADDIRRAYRALAKELHPDVRPGDKAAEERFKRATAAFNLLSDPVTKQRFIPGDESPHMYSGNREFFFESDSSRRVFAAMPMDFMNPAYHMYPKDSTKVEG